MPNWMSSMILRKITNAWMQDFELRIKEETGIKNLRSDSTKSLAIILKCPKGQVSQVPDSFIRKQTLVNGERYIVPELKAFENKILSAKEKIQQLDIISCNEIRDCVRDELVTIQDTARAIGELDAIYSLAMAAFKGNYVCPRLSDKGEIIIKDGRHPVVENSSNGSFLFPTMSI